MPQNIEYHTHVGINLQGGKRGYGNNATKDACLLEQTKQIKMSLKHESFF